MSKFALLCVVVVVGCSSEAPSKRSEPPAKTAHISSLITGSTVTLPPEIEPMLGMTSDEYKKTTQLSTTSWRSSDTVEDAAYSLYYKDGKIAQIELSSDVKLDLVPVVTAKWGPPVVSETAIGYKQYAWTNPSTKLHATITDIGGTSEVRFGFIEQRLTADR